MQKQLIANGIVLLMLVFISSDIAFAKVKIDNFATVATKGGDYTNPAMAMADLDNWCDTPSATNPCLLKIYPGSYDIGSNSVIMQSHVDIEGSGENVTTIIGNLGTDGFVRQGVLVGASNSEIRSLSVINNASSGNDAVGISYEFKSPNILHVTAKASGGTSTNVGVYINHGDSPMTLTHVTAEGTGGNNSYGIEYVDCTPTLTNVTARATGGSTRSYGVFDSNDAGGHSTIEHSVLSGENGSLLSVGFGSAHIASTRLEGSVDVGDSEPPPVCAGVYNAAFTFYASTCP